MVWASSDKSKIWGELVHTCNSIEMHISRLHHPRRQQKPKPSDEVLRGENFQTWTWWYGSARNSSRSIAIHTVHAVVQIIIVPKRFQFILKIGYYTHITIACSCKLAAAVHGFFSWWGFLIWPTITYERIRDRE